MCYVQRAVSVGWAQRARGDAGVPAVPRGWRVVDVPARSPATVSATAATRAG